MNKLAHGGWCLGLSALLSSTAVLGQTIALINGSGTACSGALLDSGGEGATGYGNNENFTYTLCPDVPGGAVSLNFITFNLSTAGATPVDGLSIHDGNSTAAPLLGTWTGTQLQGQTLSASASNPTGCLTIVFRSNNTGTGTFTAMISCFQPCIRPTAVATAGSPLPLRICPGGQVILDGSGSFAAGSATIASYTWDLGDGTLVNNGPSWLAHTYTQPGAYTAQLVVLDDQGCASNNTIDLTTLVGTAPVFTGTLGSTGCTNEAITLNGQVSGTTWTALPQANLGGAVAMPGGAGQCFTSTITYTQFSAGQTLTDISQLLGICVNMEHSYMADLVVRIISPNGQAAVLHQQGGDGTYIGGANDLDNQGNPVAGTCWNYCWSATAPWGTWAQSAASGPTPHVMLGGTPASNALMPGTYTPVQPLSNLIGSPLNGTWTLEVCDFWSLDNGFMCDWSINFDPSLFPGLFSFTPVYGAGCDSSYWSGPGIQATSADCNTATIGNLAPGSYPFTYTALDNFGCTYDTTVTVTITPDLVVDAGGDQTVCANAHVPLFASMANSPITDTCLYDLWLYDSGGNGWTVNGAVTFTINGTGSTYTLPTGASIHYVIPVPHGAMLSMSYAAGGWLGGPQQSFSLANGQGQQLYSGSNPANGVVWSGLASCPGGALVYSWSPATGLSNPAIAAPVATVTTTTQYCVTVHQEQHPDCAVTDCVTITVVPPPGPGTDTLITVCNAGMAFTMYDRLSGSPEPGGTWTAPGGGGHNGSFVPGTDAAGTYTYTVNGTGACLATIAQYTLTVQVASTPDSGSDGSVTVCSSGGPVVLFNQLGGTPDLGGTWGGPSPVVAGLFNPATMAAGTYTYTVSVPPPCTSSSSTVAITVQPAPDAGNNGSMTLCLGEAPSSLFDALGGTPDAGGNWSGPSTVANNLFDPASMAGGTYAYTVAGAAPCPSAASQVVVSVTPLPNTGTDGNLVLCSTTAPVDLFQQLGGGAQAGGTWSGPSPVVGGMFDPSGMNVGTYMYTISLPAPCLGSSSSVEVGVNEAPKAGSNGALSLCGNDAPVNLFSYLGGTPDPNGSWSGPSPISGGNFDPGIMAAGAYAYVVAALPACTNDTAYVAVATTSPTNAGVDANIALCTSAAPLSLFGQLGGTPDPGGSWSGPNGYSGNILDPSSASPGTYHYAVAGTAPCPSDTAALQITFQVPPVPGFDGMATLCPDASPLDLFLQLGGMPEANGTWTAPSGAPHASQFDPANDPPGTYTYTVAATAPCPNNNNQSTVTVGLVAAPSAGADGVNCTLEGVLQASGSWAAGHWTGSPGALIADPEAAYSAATAAAAGLYQFVWNTVSVEGCQFTDTVALTFTDAIIPAVEVTPTICHGSCDGGFMASATGGNTGWSGYTYALSGANGSPMPITTGYCAGEYLLTVLDTNNCTATVAFSIPQPPPLAMGLLTTVDALCSYSCDGTLQVGDTAGVLFRLNDGAPQPSGLFTGLCPGSYTATMWNALGCSASGTAVVGSPPPVTAAFLIQPGQVYVDAPEVVFTNASSANAGSFQWEFGDGHVSADASPVHTYPVGAAAEYEVCLSAFTGNGCVDTDCALLRVLDRSAIFLPNSFTPDGDGRNDVFQVLGTGFAPEGFLLRVYTRWGELVFETADHQAGWDGTRNGAAMEGNVYVWSLSAHFTGSIEPYERKGHVTLVR